MGHGRWESTGRSFYISSSASASNMGRDEYFKSRTVTDELNVKKITGVRESRDSEQNPESNAIILGLDVTGSMGDIAHQIAKDGLGKIIEGILDQQPVTDPHIMFTAIGDVRYDSTPLQASQFEADHRIIEQLNQIYLEGGGGGNATESYDLAWYFAGTLTSIDCFEKRNKKGYIFTFGDEEVPAGITEAQLKAVFDKGTQHGATASQAFDLANKMYHVFHVIIEEGSHCRYRNKVRVINGWKQLLGNRALPLDNYHHLPELVLAAMHIAEGADIKEVINNTQGQAVKNSLRHAFGV